ncbi:hypothetical protein [Streptomyces gilvosporeus]|nr:hypothetical protein [Streptomyces gilvosporeus]
MIGEVPNVMETESSLMWTSSTVSWLMVAIFSAQRMSSNPHDFTQGGTPFPSFGAPDP